MEFNEKLQILRKQKGLTQEELATQLYVSRTAISKWESGRGTPSIDSLKAIACFFSVTVDDLLSSEQLLTIAEKDQKQRNIRMRDLMFGLLDICLSLSLFLPLFAEKTDDYVRAVSLMGLIGIRSYIKISFLVLIAMTAVFGILMLSMQNYKSSIWEVCKTKVSLFLSTVAVLLFILTQQPYMAVFAFALLIIKVIVWMKGK